MTSEPRLRVVDADGRHIDDPTKTQVHDMLADMNARHPFVILLRLDLEPAGQHYMQTRIVYRSTEPQDNPNDPAEIDYEVEYRAGGPRQHYSTFIVPEHQLFAPEPVAELFDDWAHERPGWRDEHRWHRVELDG